MPSPPWCRNAAVVVAESLQRVSLPLAGTGPAPASPRHVASALARSLLPPSAPDSGPRWLRPGQAASFGRALAALRLHGGALLAEPVGTGKTYVALAAAKALGRPFAVVVPAALRDQWHATLGRLDLTATISTHEQWSRAPRPVAAGLVIVDEAHRFRNPAIRRYRHLAPELVGRPVLLLTATPVVNGADDLVNLLLLGLRDDVLAPFGAPSLGAAVEAGPASGALAHVVVREMGSDGIPRREPRTLSAGRDSTLPRMLGGLDALVLSRTPAVRSLLQTGFTAALASSRAAYREVLGRYRLLLLQADDAGRTGRVLDRRAIRRALDGDLAQTVLWDLFEEEAGTVDLVPDDLPRLAEAIAAARDAEKRRDPKVERLLDLLADGVSTVVFVSSRATVAYLRDRLTLRRGVAWCTGTAAGIGAARLARSQVLGWFRPGMQDPNDLAPRVLVTTDVAAEGLDLQRAARVVHYDLPWTSVRLEQRAGRAARFGSPHAAVEVVAFRPPPLLERRLGVQARIGRKAAHAVRLGMGPEGIPWSWYREIAREADDAASAGLAMTTGGEPGALAGVDLWRGRERLGGMVLARMPSGAWTGSPAIVATALRRAWESEPLALADHGLLRREMARFLRQAEALRRRAEASARVPGHFGSGRAGLVRRVRARGLEAVRARDHAAIAAVDRALAALGRGWTAGERLLVERLTLSGIDDLLNGLAALPTAARDLEPLRLRFAGLVRFDLAAGPSRGR